VMFVEGCVAVAVGVGIGLPHLAKTGFGAATVAGLIVLAGGLVLVGAGAVALVRLTPRWRRLLVVPAELVVLLLLVWTLGQATAATNVPRTDLGSATPRDVGSATATSSSRHLTGSLSRPGTSRRRMPPQSSCCMAQGRRAQVSSTTLPSWRSMATVW
jgi:hypothetical protein